MKKFTVDKEQTLIEFLSKKLNLSKKKAKKIIDTKNVLVNNRRIWIASFVLEKGTVVEVPELLDRESNYKILYEDRYIIAVNKPPFIVSDKEKNSLENLLRREISEKIKAIHRLDKETSGVLLFAKDRKVYEIFKKIWNEKHVKKEYEAISQRKAEFKEKKVNYKIGGKDATSIVRVINTSDRYTHFSVNPLTGRKHQIRIHLSKIGHPVVGDKIYGTKTVRLDIEKEVNRHLLHAKRLIIFHPFYKKILKIESPLPEDFTKFIEKEFKNKV